MVLGFVHHHHDIVSRLVIHQQLAVTVVDTATGRIFNFLEKGIGVGTLLIVVTGNLEHKQPDDVDHHYQNGHTSYHIASVVQAIVPHSLPLLIGYLCLTASKVNIKTSVNTALPTTQSAQCRTLKKLKCSNVKNIKQWSRTSGMT